MGWGGPGPGGFHITETPKPLGALKKLCLKAKEAFMADGYLNHWYIS